VTDSASFTTPEAGDEDLGDLLLEVLPPDGSTIGNLPAQEALGPAAEHQISGEEYEAVKDKAIAVDLVAKGVVVVVAPMPLQRLSLGAVATQHQLHRPHATPLVAMALPLNEPSRSGKD